MENPKLLHLDFGFDINPIPKQHEKTINKKRAKQDFIFEFLDALKSPVIIYNTTWQDAIPKGLLEKITISRMMCLMKGEFMASLTEVVAYMMPRTLEAPLSSDWCNIYTWCGLQYVTQFNSENKKKAMIDAMAKIAPNELSDYEMGLLNGLRRWIYDKRRKALKDILKKNKISRSDGILDIQEKLFQ